MLLRFQDFKLNENVAAAKKILKDTFVLNKALKELNLGFKTDSTGMFLFDKSDAPINFSDLPEQVQVEVKKKIREIKLTEEEQRVVERHPKLNEIREILGDKLGWADLFAYLYFKEKVEIYELNLIFDDLVVFQD